MTTGELYRSMAVAAYEPLACWQKKWVSFANIGSGLVQSFSLKVSATHVTFRQRKDGRGIGKSYLRKTFGTLRLRDLDVTAIDEI